MTSAGPTGPAALASPSGGPATTLGARWARLRERVRASVRPPRRLSFTRLGKLFTGMTLLLGFAAVNTGNNLLYLLLGVMLALIVVSGVLSESVLRALTVTRRLPERAFAGHPAPAALLVRNDKPRVPSFSLQVLERVEGLADEQRPGVYLLRVDAASQAKAPLRLVFPHRGRWRLLGFEVATRFPFGLFRKSRDLPAPAELVVYPSPVDPPPLPELAVAARGEAPRRQIGHGGEIYGVREHRPGEDARDLHWKLSAKRDQLISREYEAERSRQVMVCLDNRGAALRPDGRRLPAATEHAELELAVSLCAGLARDLLRRGFLVGLATRGSRVDPGTGAAQLDRLLHALALVRFSTQPPGGAPAGPGGAAPLSVRAGEACLLVAHASLAPTLAGVRLLAHLPVGAAPGSSAEASS